MSDDKLSLDESFREMAAEGPDLSDYSEETTGSRITREARVICNNLTPEEREELDTRGAGSY